MILARVLEPEAALRHIAGDDQRPMLVLRECDDCKGTDHALFERGMHNEKTRLLVRYFHCVKLGPDVAAEDHPLHRLFETKGKHRPHVFVSSVDGSRRTNFSGLQSQSELRRALTKLIQHSYAKTPDFSKLLPSFSKLDSLDARLRELASQLQRAEKRQDVDPARLRKLTRETEATEQGLDTAEDAIDVLTNLPLRRAKTALRARPPMPKPAPNLPIRKFEDFYIGGGIRARYYLDGNDQRVGTYIRYFKSGKVKQRCEYAGGVRWGRAVHFHPNGRRKLVTRFENGLEHGERVTYNRFGKVLARQHYVDGETRR